MLSPGNMMVHENSTGKQLMLPVEGNVAAWIKGELVYNGVSLKEALQRISEAYSIHVTADHDITSSYTVTGHFEKESPEHILDALLAVYGLKWRIVSGIYQVYQ
jgi:ferric-dicitrate binding protein FerR (iron transport regulator)